jgi:hypothetical protein
MKAQIPASQRKKTIMYLNLLSYSPPERAAAFQPFEQALQAEVGSAWPETLFQACSHIVAFHQASRDPDSDLVEALVDAASSAAASPEGAQVFRSQMQAFAQLSGRADPENRIHRKRGCQLCQNPCRYGYFSLLSEPNFDSLQQALEAENRKPIEQQRPVQLVWRFTLRHLSQTLDLAAWDIDAADLGNLAYCLLSLATAKSRYPFPKEKFEAFQALNQARIRAYTVN